MRDGTLPFPSSSVRLWPAAILFHRQTTAQNMAFSSSLSLHTEFWADLLKFVKHVDILKLSSKNDVIAAASQGQSMSKSEPIVRGVRQDQVWNLQRNNTRESWEESEIELHHCVGGRHLVTLDFRLCLFMLPTPAPGCPCMVQGEIFFGVAASHSHCHVIPSRIHSCVSTDTWQISSCSRFP